MSRSVTAAVTAAVPANAWENPRSDGVASFRYFDRQFGMEAVKVLPGEYSVSLEDNVLVTVLGSCVSACLRDPLAGVGGMNHFMLPDTEGGPGSAGGMSARYGSFAMELLVNELLKHGARRANIEAKVFGGGNVLRGFTSANVGTRNAAFVLDYLQTEHIHVAASDLLDNCPRKVHYFPRTGRVLVRRLATINTEEVAQDLAAETTYGSRLRSNAVVGVVELFN